MLQQTPVNRVLPVYRQWVEKWPLPSALALEPVSEAVRAWGRLGYPRRAQRLHATAVIIDRDFDDVVPSDEQNLRSLPGVGEYTAAAIAAFAFQAPTMVLDTNIRRVLSRHFEAKQWPSSSISNAERELAISVMPKINTSTYSAAIMELGALVCTANNPLCDVCPVKKTCAWVNAGSPQMPRTSKTQEWHGTNRQCRGAVLNWLRDKDTLTIRDFEKLWSDRNQLDVCIAQLESEGFIAKTRGVWRLA